jgi:hypothetical protein
MFTLLSRKPTDRRIEAATLVAAMVIAELAYKFRSFTLECAAFLATWACLSAVAHAAFRRPRVA